MPKEIADKLFEIRTINERNLLFWELVLMDSEHREVTDRIYNQVSEEDKRIWEELYFIKYKRKRGQ